MIDITKFYLEQFRKYLTKKNVDFEKMPKDKYWEEFNKWAEENNEDLLKQYHEAHKKFYIQKRDVRSS